MPVPPDPPDHEFPTGNPVVERAGYAVILGEPNTGKSTLTNRLVGSRVTIVTHKAQTTRFATRAVIHHHGAQIVLIDTPGVFSARKNFERMMVKAVWNAAEEADSIIHLIDASACLKDTESRGKKGKVENDHQITTWLKKGNRKAIAALNKIDLFAHEQVLPLIATLDKTGIYQDIVMLSARNGDGVGLLVELVARSMPKRPALYQPGDLTDLPRLAAEITREKLMLRLHQELPYQLKVDPESWETCADGTIRIRQVVITNNHRHKGIILGNQGQTIKAVGQSSRRDLASILRQPVHLFLHVRVETGWMDTQTTTNGQGRF